MNEFLIRFGANNTMLTVEAEDPASAVEQAAQILRDEYDTGILSINDVSLLMQVDADHYGHGYATHPDTSTFFGLDDLVIQFVPEEHHNDADEVEEFLFS